MMPRTNFETCVNCAPKYVLPISRENAFCSRECVEAFLVRWSLDHRDPTAGIGSGLHDVAIEITQYGGAPLYGWDNPHSCASEVVITSLNRARSLITRYPRSHRHTYFIWDVGELVGHFHHTWKSVAQEYLP